MPPEPTELPSELIPLIFDCAHRAAADILFEFILELENFNDPVCMKVKAALIQAIRNRVLGPGFLAGIGSNLP